MKLFEMHLERQQHGSTHKTFLQNFDLLLFCFSVALMFCPQMVSCPTSLSYFDNDFFGIQILCLYLLRTFLLNY